MEGFLVRLIYTDEAGTSAKEPVCVVAAVIVEGDRQWRLLDEDIRRIIADRVPSSLKDNFIFHATEVFSGGKKINRDTWNFEDRLDFIKEILCLPLVHDIPISVGIETKKNWDGIVDLSKMKFRDSKPLDSNQFAHLMAFGTCMEKSDLFLRKYLKGSEIGSVIAEDVPVMKRFLSALGLNFRENPYNAPSDHFKPEKWQENSGLAPDPVEYRIDHIIDVPHFVSKGRAPLLQLADACAFAFRRCLSKKSHGDDMIMAMLGPVAGQQFLNEPTWFSGPGSGLFNTYAYWDEDQKKIHMEKSNLISLHSTQKN